ncbi:MAG TPA: glycosyltransferase family 2 protein, partial [Thermoanaerobaculia bacterium]
MTPGVTIGIPLFNGARFLRRTIESLLAQTRTDFTLTVFDDRSTDDSVAIARSFDDPRLRVEVNPVRRGLGGNWNAVLERASTPYAVIAHQDDVYEPHYLETVVALLESQPRAFIAHTRATYIDEHERALGSVASRYKDAFWPRDEPAMREPREELRVLQQGNYIICPSAIYRMSAVARIGPFDESLRFVTDWDYWLRGLMAGFTIAGTHARLICWRRHSSSA